MSIENQLQNQLRFTPASQQAGNVSGVHRNNNRQGAQDFADLLGSLARGSQSKVFEGLSRTASISAASSLHSDKNRSLSQRSYMWSGSVFVEKTARNSRAADRSSVSGVASSSTIKSNTVNRAQNADNPVKSRKDTSSRPVKNSARLGADSLSASTNANRTAGNDRFAADKNRAEETGQQLVATLQGNGEASAKTGSETTALAQGTGQSLEEENISTGVAALLGLDLQGSLEETGDVDSEAILDLDMAAAVDMAAAAEQSADTQGEGAKLSDALQQLSIDQGAQETALGVNASKGAQDSADLQGLNGQDQNSLATSQSDLSAEMLLNPDSSAGGNAALVTDLAAKTTQTQVGIASAQVSAQASAVLAASSQASGEASPVNNLASINGASNLGINASSNINLAVHSPAQTPVAQTSPGQPAAQVYVPNLPEQMSTQLQAHLGRLRASGDGTHQLRLAINPEAFGPVRVAATFHPDGSVHLQLLAASEAAREQLRQSLSELRRELAQTGMETQLDLADNASEFETAFGRDQGGENEANQGVKTQTGLEQTEKEPDEPAQRGQIPHLPTSVDDSEEGRVDVLV